MRHLYELGYLPNPGMCRWHCRCDNCSLDSGYLFRAQTDSSCSGEVITSILHHDPAHPRHPGINVFHELQVASLAVDSEPGLDAGMHVHVGINHLSSTQMARAFWAFLKYEGLLVRLAAGRFPTQRENNNAVGPMMVGLLRNYGGPHRRLADLIEHFEAPEQEDDLFDVMCGARGHHYEHDRHSNLNLNTGHHTWEFRLWNSTRSAWRMEMFTRLSVAMVDPEVVESLIVSDFPRRVTRQSATRFAELLDAHGHGRVAELTERQAEYAWNDAANAPSTLTIF